MNPRRKEIPIYLEFKTSGLWHQQAWKQSINHTTRLGNGISKAFSFNEIYKQRNIQTHTQTQIKQGFSFFIIFLDKKWKVPQDIQYLVLIKRLIPKKCNTKRRQRKIIYQEGTWKCMTPVDVAAPTVLVPWVLPVLQWFPIAMNDLSSPLLSPFTLPGCVFYFFTKTLF